MTKLIVTFSNYPKNTPFFLFTSFYKIHYTFAQSCLPTAACLTAVV